MKACIIFGFILFVVVVAAFSTFFYIKYGWVALVAYLTLATPCITPMVRSLHSWHKEKGGQR